MKGMMVNVLSALILIFLMLLRQNASAAASSVDSCRPDAIVAADSRQKTDLSQLPDGIYKWEQSHFFAEKIVEDKDADAAREPTAARMIYREIRNEDNQVESAIVCMKGLYQASPIENWTEYLPAVAAVVIENGELVAFKLRKYLLNVGDRVKVEGGRLTIEAGRSLQDFIKYSGVKMEVFRLAEGHYQIQISRHLSKGTSATAVMDLSYRR